MNIDAGASATVNVFLLPARNERHEQAAGPMGIENASFRSDRPQGERSAISCGTVNIILPTNSPGACNIGLADIRNVNVYCCERLPPQAKKPAPEPGREFMEPLVKGLEGIESRLMPEKFRPVAMLDGYRIVGDGPRSASPTDVERGWMALSDDVREIRMALSRVMHGYGGGLGHEGEKVLSHVDDFLKSSESKIASDPDIIRELKRLGDELKEGLKKSGALATPPALLSDISVSVQKAWRDAGEDLHALRSDLKLSCQREIANAVREARAILHGASNAEAQLALTYAKKASGFLATALTLTESYGRAARPVLEKIVANLARFT